MRQEVYTKFAEALQRKQSEQAAATRHQEVVTKFAEALDRQMAQKQAETIYCEGFRKAAELAGVDPNALVKQALGLGDLLSLGRKAVGTAKAIGGSAKAVAGKARQAYQAAGGGLAGAKAVGGAAGQRVGGLWDRYMELLSGSKINGLRGKARLAEQLASGRARAITSGAAGAAAGTGVGVAASQAGKNLQQRAQGQQAVAQ